MAQGLSVMDPRLLSALENARVPVEAIQKLATLGVEDIATFAHLAQDETGMASFFKASLEVDVDARPTDFILRSKLLVAWSSSRARCEIEVREQAQRAVQQLPPQLTLGDHETSLRALQVQRGKALEKHQVPSKPYFERLIGLAETFYVAESLTSVTNMTQADQNQVPTTDMDASGRVYVKLATKEFVVPLPRDPEGLRNRFKVMSAAWNMLRMRFPSNPKLATISPELFDDYADYLMGTKVWGFIAKNGDGIAVSSPAIDHVIGYDKMMRDKVADELNRGVDFKTALESALKDGDIRMLGFLTPFTVDVNDNKCRSITAPGYVEHSGAKTTRRQAGYEQGTGAIPSGGVHQPHGQGLSAKAKKKAKARAAAGSAGTGVKTKVKQNQQQQQQQQQQQGQWPIGKGAKGKKGDGKGSKGAKGGKTPMVLPPGAKASHNGLSVCYSWNQGTACRSTPCGFQHVCWFCGKDAHAGHENKCA